MNQVINKIKAPITSISTWKLFIHIHTVKSSTESTLQCSFDQKSTLTEVLSEMNCSNDAFSAYTLRRDQWIFWIIGILYLWILFFLEEHHFRTIKTKGDRTENRLEKQMIGPMNIKFSLPYFFFLLSAVSLRIQVFMGPLYLRILAESRRTY